MPQPSCIVARVAQIAHAAPAAHPHADSTRLGRLQQARAGVQLNRHRQSITGPIRKTRLELKESILTSSRFQQFMDTYSKNRELPIHEVRKKADAYIDD